MPKSKVATAARILGQNPAESHVAQIVSKWDSNGTTMEQFQEVLSQLDDGKPTDEMLLENISVFDIDGEGEVPLSQFKYLMCSSDSGEGLTSEEFDFLLETVKRTSCWANWTRCCTNPNSDTVPVRSTATNTAATGVVVTDTNTDPRRSTDTVMDTGTERSGN